MQVLVIIAILVFGVFQIAAGSIGIADQFGVGWAIASVVAALAVRFTLPLSVGVFFFVVNTLQWHWFFALLVAAPGLAVMIPGFVAVVLEGFGSRGRASPR